MNFNLLIIAVDDLQAYSQCPRKPKGGISFSLHPDSLAGCRVGRDRAWGVADKGDATRAGGIKGKMICSPRMYAANTPMTSRQTRFERY